ncbi:unnamed protein product [Symbiodinium sp. KB8]|nr:unnamed protein product [Symbiodinium sp. KB8]
MENLEKCTQDYLEELLSEMSETATLEDLIRRIGEKQRERILKPIPQSAVGITRSPPAPNGSS